jgi:hypothetical protein
MGYIENTKGTSFCFKFNPMMTTEIGPCLVHGICKISPMVRSILPERAVDVELIAAAKKRAGGNVAKVGHEAPLAVDKLYAMLNLEKI